MPHVMAHPHKFSCVFQRLPCLAAERGTVCVAVFSTVRCSVLRRWCCGPPTCALVGALGPAWREAPLFIGGGMGAAANVLAPHPRGGGSSCRLPLCDREAHLFLGGQCWVSCIPALCAGCRVCRCRGSGFLRGGGFQWARGGTYDAAQMGLGVQGWKPFDTGFEGGATTPNGPQPLVPPPSRARRSVSMARVGALHR